MSEIAFNWCVSVPVLTLTFLVGFLLPHQVDVLQSLPQLLPVEVVPGVDAVGDGDGAGGGEAAPGPEAALAARAVAGLDAAVPVAATPATARVIADPAAAVARHPTPLQNIF